ncbi:hypothetical protein JCM11641_007381 [Rhodosporidiobolus odoratus]
MTSPSSDDIVSQRRGSAASSVSVTIETTTTSTALNPGDTSVPSPVRLSSIEPFAGRPLSPLPTTCSEPPCLPLLPPSISVEMEPNTAAYQFPPPPYTSPPSQSSTSPPRACVTPLSFFPFSTLTPVTSTFPPLPEACSNPIPSPPSAPSSQFSRHLSAPPRCFWWGFLCPLIWFAGVYRLWRSERPAAFSGEKSSNGANVDVEAQVEVSMREMGVWSGYPERVGVMGKEEVQESLKLWREEEVLWGKRCAWSICAVLAIGAVIGIIVSSMLGKI